MGNALLYQYYYFLHEYGGREPRDLDDLFDGLRSSGARQEIDGPQAGGTPLWNL